MTELSDMQKQTKKAVRTRQEREQPRRPAVDIIEDDYAITVHADMPGVSRERLEIQVERDSLSIEGQAEIDLPDGLQDLYSDVRSTRYQRSFTLSQELDGERAEASLKDGVLKLRIPKKAMHQPRKIEVRVA